MRSWAPLKYVDTALLGYLTKVIVGTSFPDQARETALRALLRRPPRHQDKGAGPVVVE